MHHWCDFLPREPVATGDVEAFMYGVHALVSNLSAQLPRDATRIRTSPRPVHEDELGRCGATRGAGVLHVRAALASHGRGHSAPWRYTPSNDGGHTSRTPSSLHKVSQRSSDGARSMPRIATTLLWPSASRLL